MVRKYRNHSPAVKFKIAIEAAQNQKTVNQIVPDLYALCLASPKEKKPPPKGVGVVPENPIEEGAPLPTPEVASSASETTPPPAVTRFSYTGPTPPPAQRYQTRFSVVETDTISAVLSQPEKKWCVLNLANSYLPGGAFGKDWLKRPLETRMETKPWRSRPPQAWGAQEESLCEVAPDLYETLLTAQQREWYPLNSKESAHALYSSGIPLHIERMAPPQPPSTTQISVVSCALFDLRTKTDRKSDLIEFDLPKDNPPVERTLRAHAIYMNSTRGRINAILGAAKAHGETNLMLGAIGCGCFLNPTPIVTDLLYEALSSDEFSGCFENVSFAILNSPPLAKEFAALCQKLQAPQGPYSPPRGDGTSR